MTNLFRKLSFVTGLLVLEKLMTNVFGRESDDTFHCQYVEELYEKGLNGGNSRELEFDCWESHLTDVSRYRLFSFFDRYRAEIANASCRYCVRNNLQKYDNVFRMNYHWVLEYLANEFETKEWTGPRTDRWQILNTDLRYEILRKVEDYHQRGIASLGSLDNNRDLVEDYKYTMLSIWTRTNELYEQSDVINQFIDILGNHKEEELFWTEDHQLSLVMRPGTVYVGCSLRCNERFITTEVVPGASHQLTCVFATPHEVFDGYLTQSAGTITQNSCNRAKPGSRLKRTDDGLPICVDGEYENAAELKQDWPCPFHYFVTSEEIYDDGTSRKSCRENYEHRLPNRLRRNIRVHYGGHSIFRDKDDRGGGVLLSLLDTTDTDTDTNTTTTTTTTTTTRPIATRNRYKSPRRFIVSVDLDPIDAVEEESICESGVGVKLYKLPEYLDSCDVTNTPFLVMAGVFLFGLAVLMGFHYFGATGYTDRSQVPYWANFRRRPQINE